MSELTSRGDVKVVIGSATLYLGDCLEILPTLPQVDAVITDPPYGIGYEINARKERAGSLVGTGPFPMNKRPAIHGDDRPFDPAPFFPFDKLALFGANYMMNLPRGEWVVWDKRRDSSPDDHSDCEFIWLNKRGADRIHRQKWRGVVREGEENCANSKKLHPNQKPVALLKFIFGELGVAAGETVLDPYMGSASTGVAAMRSGCPFIGIEIDPKYFDIACLRLDIEQRQMRMFA